jgi:hypothetical protein
VTMAEPSHLRRREQAELRAVATLSGGYS